MRTASGSNTPSIRYGSKMVPRTPDFAVEALRQLVEGGYNVVGVITMPDKPAGRGHKILRIVN